MVGEIVFIHVGGCGLQLGAALWERLAEERGPEADGAGEGQSAASDALFVEESGRRRPRAIFADLDPYAVATVRQHPALVGLPAEVFVAGEGGTALRWSEGYAGAGRRLLDRIASAVGREVEGCRELQGFVVVHAVGGGTGGGLGSLVVEHLRTQHPRATIATFTVLSSSQRESAPATAVNQARALAALRTTADLCLLLGNEAVDNVLFRAARIPEATHAERNDLFAQAMASVVSAWRSPAGVSMREMAVSLNPLPGASYHAIAHIPLLPKGFSARKQTVPDLVLGVFSRQQLLLSIDPLHGKWLSSICLLHGDVSEGDGEAAVLARVAAYSPVDWLWDPAKVRVESDASAGNRRSATLVGTTTAVQEQLKDVSHSLMLAKRTTEAVSEGWASDATLEDAAATLEAIIAQLQAAHELGAGGSDPSAGGGDSDELDEAGFDGEE